MQHRRIALALATAAGAALVAGAVASGEVPRWTWGGTRMAVGPGLPPIGECPVDVPAGGRVVFEGDSNMAGSRVGDAAPAFPAIMAAHAGHAAAAENRAFGGATAADGLARSRSLKGARLVIVMFGTNDAAPRAWLSRREPVAFTRYGDALARLIRDRQAQGANVLVLAPPPSGSRAMERRLAPYRAAARQAAQETGALFRDPAEAFAGQAAREPLLRHDALHLNSRAHKLLGEWLAACVRWNAALPA